MTRKHTVSDLPVPDLAVCLPSSFRLLASPLLQVWGYAHRAGRVSAMTQSTHGPDYAIFVRVQFPLLHQQASQLCG